MRQSAVSQQQLAEPAGIADPRSSEGNTIGENLWRSGVEARI